MSVSEKTSVAFAYESSVHSTNVLLSLNDQRQRDLLCDVTVLVEDRRFRAHRAVLAACSNYFLARVVGQAEQQAELTIALPEEVTVKGFKPLIQFAYTAKLTLNRDNVDEVCKCVRFLGVHNIEESCFQFLRLKFLDSPADPPECPRPECLTPHCPRRAGLDLALSRPGAAESDDDVEDFLEKEREQAAEAGDPRPGGSGGGPGPGPAGGRPAGEAPGEEDDGAPGPPSLCPKYRKFQKAFGTDRARTAEPGPGEARAPAAATAPPGPAQPARGPETPAPGPADLPPAARCEGPPSGPGGGEAAEAEGGAARRPEELPSGSPFPPSAALDPHGLYSLSLLPAYDQYGDLAFAGAGGADPGRERAAAEGPGEAGGRSSVEREVAEHLAKGFWSDVCGPDAARPVRLSPAAGDGADQPPAPAQRRSECPWLGIRISESPEPGPRTFATLSAVSCPFMSHLGAEGCSDGPDGGGGDGAAEGARRAEEGAEAAVACQYACEIGLGDESETDTEGDSESCSAREQECEVKLPFNAQRIISLSRNDFQSLLKMHRLTPEQLDCIHDIRRRSKNRIAAQRCRKRKLDCIQNLESEIEKLQSEKESLLRERDHILSTLGETKQNLTGLCQQVCKEAALSREQIQILAKYSASDCPLSFFVSDRGGGGPDGQPAPPAAAEPGRDGGPAPPRDAEPAGPPAERCCQGGGITDFCQQMTEKCTTDE
ncbi:transcription regulator protein BACH1 [Ornithorhynchus anatinus]|uniref:BTB domain and CNC homolog 1 n=1 Tax=Ornithorhynchus anatinus TaxID=9258 RepID=A0A6I8P0G2_ORNAN|nr:transcription regulator protein BACH1 [Ornithorhynchus anatinus]